MNQTLFPLRPRWKSEKYRKEALANGNVESVGNDSRYADSEFGEGILSVPQLHLKEFNFTGGVSG